jgi:hypothetical protein
MGIGKTYRYAAKSVRPVTKTFLLSPQRFHVSFSQFWGCFWAELLHVWRVGMCTYMGTDCIDVGERSVEGLVLERSQGVLFPQEDGPDRAPSTTPHAEWR